MPKAETRFELQKMLSELTDAFLIASKDLRKEFEKPDWAESPFIYHMPKMTVSMQVALSYSGEKVSGNFITGRKSAKEENELVTTIDIDVVSVPRMDEGLAPSEARGRIPPEESGSGSDEGPAARDETGNGDELGPAGPGDGSVEAPEPPAADESREAARPAAPPLPTRDLSLRNIGWDAARKRLTILGFTDIRRTKQTRNGFEFRAQWQTEAKKLRLISRTGVIEEMEG